MVVLPSLRAFFSISARTGARRGRNYLGPALRRPRKLHGGESIQPAVDQLVCRVCYDTGAVHRSYCCVVVQSEGRCKVCGLPDQCSAVPAIDTASVVLNNSRQHVGRFTSCDKRRQRKATGRGRGGQEVGVYKPLLPEHVDAHEHRMDGLVDSREIQYHTDLPSTSFTMIVSTLTLWKTITAASTFQAQSLH